jgi:osmotically inducible protein OsmC
MATDRKAEVTWHGDLMSGSGRIDSVTSGAVGGLDVDWTARSEDAGSKTSPEELIAAAHATCVSMALANGLAQAGHAPTRLETDAVCTLEQTDAGFRITSMRLSVRGEVDGLGEDDFRAAAQEAKEGCPVSNALSDSIEVTLEASLS